MLIALGDIYAQIPRREDVRELMRVTQARAREQPGCVYYEFAETLDDPGHFVVVAQWRDQAALDQHYRSDAFADYQARIGQHLVRTSELSVHAVQTSLRATSAEPLEAAEDD
jgi:quinol monooxygenase YgiN